MGAEALLALFWIIGHERLSEGSVRGEVFYYMSKAKKKLVIKTVAAIPGVCFVAWQCHIRFP